VILNEAFLKADSINRISGNLISAF